jgi:anti-sigma regulatory factor (Ser/Thr protein kinase)
MNPLNVQILSDDLPPAEAGRLVAACGWTAGRQGPRLTLTRCFGIETVKTCLEPPGHGGLEIGEAEFRPPGPRFMGHLAQGGLALFISTTNAYQYDVAQVFTAALARHLDDLTEDGLADLGLAIHELMANALIHGNLGVASPKPGLEGFDAYCRSLEAALARPDLIARPVELSAAWQGGVVEVAVRDHGAGYDPRRRRPPNPNERSHGLSMVAEMGDVVVEEGGRCTIARFALGGRS